MKKLAKYLKEKYNRKLLESKNGFITYEIYRDGSCYIHTLWIDKDHRNRGEGRSLEQAIIKKENPKVIYCDVDKESKGWKTTLRILLLSGYEIDKDMKYKIVLFRDLK